MLMLRFLLFFFFFFQQKTAYEMRISDWSSDVCSSDLTWSKNEIGSGKIDVAGTCTQGAQKVELALAGTLDTKKSDVLVTSKGKSPMGGGDMEMQKIGRASGRERVCQYV